MQEGKKKFEKQTAKFCMSQERYLNLSTKKQDAVLKEVRADIWYLYSQSLSLRNWLLRIRIFFFSVEVRAEVKAVGCYGDLTCTENWYSGTPIY